MMSAGVMSVGLADTQEVIRAREHAFMEARIEQYNAADRAETTAYHSDRDAEVTKFLRKTNSVIGSYQSDFLSTIPIPSASDGVKDIIKVTTKNFTGGKFVVVDFLPVWTGEKWMDGMSLAVNGFDVPKKILPYLRDLNWLERVCGNYFYSKVEESKVEDKEMKTFGGFPPTVRLSSKRFALESFGYDLKFDKTFYVWRVVGLNVPPEMQECFDAQR